MRFVDLFAGLGGFHQALASLGHDCVLASELDPQLIDLYELNYGIRPSGDVTKIPLEEIPEHDVLCAGFPCQPFSKAGAQLGREYRGSGTLFDNVLRILRKRRPAHVILENVPNLLRHDEGWTWRGMEGQLARIGYDVRSTLLSPHMFGIPQVRDRHAMLRTAAAVAIGQVLAKVGSKEAAIGASATVRGINKALRGMSE